MCETRAEKCRESCLNVNKRCRQGDRSCQQNAETKVGAYVGTGGSSGLIATDADVVKYIPMIESESCYDQTLGMNRHAMCNLQFLGLNEPQKVDYLNYQHPSLDRKSLKEITLNDKIDFEASKKVEGEPSLSCMRFIDSSEWPKIGDRPIDKETLRKMIVYQ